MLHADSHAVAVAAVTVDVLVRRSCGGCFMLIRMQLRQLLLTYLYVAVAAVAVDAVAADAVAVADAVVLVQSLRLLLQTLIHLQLQLRRLLLQMPFHMQLRTLSLYLYVADADAAVVRWVTPSRKR
jgi:hypothetical protein